MFEMTGADLEPKYYICEKCQAELWGDHGWIRADGSVICREEHKCNLRVTLNLIDSQIAAGTWKPRCAK